MLWRSLFGLSTTMNAVCSYRSSNVPSPRRSESDMSVRGFHSSVVTPRASRAIGRPTPNAMPTRTSGCTSSLPPRRALPGIGAGSPARTAVFLDWGFVERSVSAQLGGGLDFRDLSPTRLAQEIVSSRKWASTVNFTAVFDGIHDQHRRPADYARTFSWAQQCEADANTKVYLQHLQYLPDGSFRQKGTDVELALEMVDAARSERFDIIIAFTGDRDLLPAARRVLDAGVRFESACWGRRRSGLSIPEARTWCHALDVAAFRRSSTPRPAGSSI